MRGANLISILLGVATTPARVAADSGTVWATPHDSYSSSVGVLGCKVNTNRIAYWPGSISCDNLCVELSYGDRSVHLLRIDQSEGAHDVSYDAWNYLYTGHSATDRPTAGGGVPMEFRDVDVGECRDLIKTKGGKLPLSAPNSMNFLASCLEGDTWVGRNHVLYNIMDPICTWGYDEACDLDWPAANQAKCPHALGTPESLKSAPVWNIMYPSGQKHLAGSVPVAPGAGAPADSRGSGVRWERAGLVVSGMMVYAAAFWV